MSHGKIVNPYIKDATKQEKHKTMTTNAAAPKKAGQVLTPEFRVSFASVFAARAAAEGQEPKFSLTMLFPKTTDISALKQAVLEAIIAKWGPEKAKWPKGLRLPFRDGSEKEYDGYENTTFCTASSKMRPGLVNQEMVQITTPDEFYSGCYARATIAAFAYDKAGNKGVSWGLRNIQKTRDGEPFSGKNKPEADFDAIPVPKPSAGESASAGAGAAGGASIEDMLA